LYKAVFLEHKGKQSNKILLSCAKNKRDIKRQKRNAPDSSEWVPGYWL